MWKSMMRLDDIIENVVRAWDVENLDVVLCPGIIYRRLSSFIVVYSRLSSFIVVLCPGISWFIVVYHKEDFNKLLHKHYSQ
jgi:hypothetical protein